MKPKDLRLLLSLSSSRRLFIGVALAAPISAAIIIANGLLLGAIIVGVIYHHPDTFQWILLLTALWLFRAIYTSFFENWCSVTATNFKSELRNRTTEKIGRFHSLGSSELSAVLIKGANSLDVYLGRFLPQLFSASVTPIAVIATIFFLDPLSALIALITLPLIPFFGALIGRYTSDAVSRKWSSLGTLSRYFEDSLRGFLTLKIFGRHLSQAGRIKKMGDQYTKETMEVLRVSFLSALVLELAATISVALIAVSIGLRLVEGEISFIAGLTVLILAPEVYFPLRNAASLFHASADGGEILNKLATIEEGIDPLVTQMGRDFSDAESVSWENWRLDLPGVAPSRLDGATVKKGEVLFIVGDSGIGKSSFVRSLMGIDSNCNLRVNGTAIQRDELSDYHSALGWIPQLPQLAPGSIREQFQLLRPGISDEEIIEALSTVSLPLSQLPAGLDSYLGAGEEKSAHLSGGQIRKIAVARALIRSPFLIVADEPTADLDFQSSDAIMKALRNAVSRGAALICITHDRDIVRGDDRLIELERVST